MTQEITTGQIAEYNEFRNQVAELVKTNEATIFDYETDKGEKDARSYVYKLKLSKGEIERKRKQLGEDLLIRTKLINGEAKSLIATVQTMIDVHMKPLEEKAEREAERKVKIDELMRELHSFRNVPLHETSSCFANLIGNFNNFIVDERFQERLSEAKEAQAKIAEFLINCHSTAVEREAAEADAERIRIEQQLELEGLRKAQAERDAKDAADEDERKRIAAEEKSKAEIIANNERIKQEAEQEAQRKANEIAQEAIRIAEEAQKAAEAEVLRIKREAEENTAKIKRDADAVEAKRMADAKAQADADAKRAANIKHIKAINNKAVTCFVVEGFSDADAKNIVTLISKGVIANIKINY